MDYIELEKIYKFSVDNKVGITKHGIVSPSKEVVEKLVENYKIKSDIAKRIQVLDDKKTVSFVISIGELTLFERVCEESDEYTVEGYLENDEESYG